MISTFKAMSENKRNLILRVLSSVLLIPAVLFLIYEGGFAFDVTVILIMALAYREWVRLVAPQLVVQTKTTGLALLVLLLACGASGLWGLALCMMVVLTFLLYLMGGRGGQGIWFGLSLPYLAGSGLALLYLRDDAFGLALICYLVGVVWATDCGAYGAGRLIGGAKIAPRISPNKTWAGLIGGMAAAGVAGWALSHQFSSANILYPITIAMFLAIVSQIGDFFESYVKRISGHKDSGHLIPGHGGILDRIDGLMAAAVFLALLHVGKGLVSL